MDAATILDRAADIMQARGKCRYTYLYPDGGVCTIGAIALACGVNAESSVIHHWHASGDHGNVFRALWDFLGPYKPVPTWSDENDAPTVIAGLRTCAAIERAKQNQSAAMPVSHTGPQGTSGSAADLIAVSA